jgi:hypothetical protein
VSYLDANKLTPPEVFRAIDPSLETWKTPNGGPSPVWDFYTMTTTGRVSINGSGEISGYGVQGTYNWVGSNQATYYSMWVKPGCYVNGCEYVNLGDNYGGDPLYRISAGYLTANSTHVSSDVDNDAAIDLAVKKLQAQLRARHSKVKAKTHMAAWALRTRTLFIAVGAAGGKRFAHQVDIDDLARTTHDPLLAQLRYRLRKHHGAARDAKKIGLPVVFSREAITPPDASCAPQQDAGLNCHGYGSVVSVTATFGQCAAGWVLDQLSRAPPSSGANFAL